MKKLSTKVLFALIAFSLLLSACGSAIPEPKADQPIDPLITWPIVCDALTGQCYEKVYRPHTKPAGSMPSLWYDYELIRLTPLSPEEVTANLATMGISPTDQVMVMTLPSEWIDEESGNQMSAAAVALNPTSGLCKALIGHLIFRATTDGVTWAAITAMIEAFSNGQITPDVVKTGSGGASAIQFTFQGIKWLILFGSSTTPPTVIGPVLGNTLGRLAGSMNSLVVGQGKAVGVVGDAIALMRCVKNNWPSSPNEAQKVKDEHNRTYSAKHLDSIPTDFPVPFPKLDQNGQMTGEVLINVQAGDFNGMERVTLQTLFAMGVVILVFDGIPYDEVAGATAYLQWSSNFAYAIP